MLSKWLARSFREAAGQAAVGKREERRARAGTWSQAPGGGGLACLLSAGPLLACGSRLQPSQGRCCVCSLLACFGPLPTLEACTKVQKGEERGAAPPPASAGCVSAQPAFLMLPRGSFLARRSTSAGEEILRRGWLGFWPPAKYPQKGWGSGPLNSRACRLAWQEMRGGYAAPPPPASALRVGGGGGGGSDGASAAAAFQQVCVCVWGGVTPACRYPWLAPWFASGKPPFLRPSALEEKEGDKLPERWKNFV